MSFLIASDVDRQIAARYPFQTGFRGRKRVLAVWKCGLHDSDNKSDQDGEVMTQGTGADRAIEKRIDNLLKGAIDPHVHSGPSIAPRAVDHLELAQVYSAAGLAAVVTKDHDY